MSHGALPIWFVCAVLTTTATRPSDSSQPEGALSAVLQHNRRIPSSSLEESSIDYDDASALPSAFLQSGAKDTDEVDDNRTAGGIDERPTAGGKADKIEFGFTFRQLYSMDLKDGTYTADIVLNFRWTDPRTAGLVTSGNHITLSEQDAKQKMWMPEMGVTNRDVRGIEVLSTAVTVSTGGKVLKVQRVLAVLKNKFVFGYYPFDDQTLLVVVSSSKYMLEDVVLEAIDDEKDSACSLVKDGAFEGKGVTLESFEAKAFEEISGALKKSRGKLEVVVRRESKKFYDSVLWPCTFLVSCSYMVFWLPLLTPFVMPRIATAMISYLAMYSMMQKYDAMIGPGAGASYGDAFLQGFGALMFSTIIINVALEATSHQLKEVEFATSLNAEMKLVYPALFLLTFLQNFLFGINGNLVLTVALFTYGSHSYQRYKLMKEPKESEEPEETEKMDAVESEPAPPPPADTPSPPEVGLLAGEATSSTDALAVSTSNEEGAKS